MTYILERILQSLMGDILTSKVEEPLPPGTGTILLESSFDIQQEPNLDRFLLEPT